MLSGMGEVFLSLILSFIGCSAISAFGYSVVSRLFSTSPVYSASTLSFCYGIIPVLASVTVAIMLLKPHWAELFFHEHCHGNVCGPHVPDVSNTIAGISFAAVAALMVGGTVYFIGRQAWRNRRRQGTLRTLADEVSPDQWSRIPGAAPVAFTGGLLRPHIYVSDAMIDVLSDDELQLLLLHEQSHMRHRDPLGRFILNWSTRLWPRHLRRRFLADHALRCEQRADYEAVNHTGRERELLVMLERLSELRDVKQCEYVEQRRLALRNKGPSDNRGRTALPLLAGVFVTEVVLLTYFVHPVMDFILMLEP